jgi:hypothetical protein
MAVFHITSVLKALGSGQIKPEEMPIATGERQRTDKIRVAPGFSVGQSAASGALPPGAYTVDGLAKFLGEVKEDTTGWATEAFKAAFGALELISEGYLAESAIKGLDQWWRVGEVASARTPFVSLRDSALGRWPLAANCLPGPTTSMRSRYVLRKLSVHGQLHFTESQVLRGSHPSVLPSATHRRISLPNRLYSRHPSHTVKRGRIAGIL